MYDNPDCRVDKRFDFYILGNNFRNTNIHAFIGLLDAERILDNIHKRIALYQVFCEEIDQEDYLTFPDEIMFSIPIIKKNPDKVSLAKKFCEENSVETRPIIAGNLLRQTCYKKYGSYTSYPVSEYINNNGFYVGLHTGLTENDVAWLAKNI
jgi:CDP-6-deoxy-D-xylo-4-hexulose-3-dehydrase